MVTFEKYAEHIKFMFKPYTRCMVELRAKNSRREIYTIVSATQPANLQGYGELGIIFDQNTIGFFGDFFGDEYIDELNNTWETRSEKEIFELLDKKIEEYKYYIDYGYFFIFYNMEGEEESTWPSACTGDLNKIDYEKLYLSQKRQNEAEYSEIKSVTVTNFYGDIIIDNKILH